MAQLLVRMPSGVRKSSKHPHVTISGFPVSVTLPITRPDVEHTDLGSVWEEIDRPGRGPILERKNRKLRKFTLEAILIHQDRSVVEETLLNLARLANNNRGPLIVSYGGLEAGYQRMTDLRARVIRRQSGTNLATRIDVSMEFTEVGERPKPIQSTEGPPASGGGVLIPGAPGGVGVILIPGGSGMIPIPTPLATRSHTVGQGETLASIGAHYGGHADFWQAIARANNITDPRRVKAGMKLQIPVSAK